jgi:predicted  nucleic acid-binding Zn-ribbon protein
MADPITYKLIEYAWLVFSVPLAHLYITQKEQRKETKQEIDSVLENINALTAAVTQLTNALGEHRIECVKTYMPREDLKVELQQCTTDMRRDISRIESNQAEIFQEIHRIAEALASSKKGE